MRAATNKAELGKKSLMDKVLDERLSTELQEQNRLAVFKWCVEVLKEIGLRSDESAKQDIVELIAAVEYLGRKRNKGEGQGGDPFMDVAVSLLDIRGLDYSMVPAMDARTQDGSGFSHVLLNKLMSRKH